MIKIARIKNDRVHFALAIAADGHVTEFTPRESEAALFTMEQADAVASHYEGRPNGGRFAFHYEDGGAARPAVEGSEGPKLKFGPVATVTPPVAPEPKSEAEIELVKLLGLEGEYSREELCEKAYFEITDCRAERDKAVAALEGDNEEEPTTSETPST